MITCTPANYWLDRLAVALDNAGSAPSHRARGAYLDLADHYRSMHELACGEKCPPFAITASAAVAASVDCSALARAA